MGRAHAGQGTVRLLKRRSSDASTRHMPRSPFPVRSASPQAAGEEGYHGRSTDPPSVHSPADFDGAFQAATRERVEVIVVSR
jgi:hypothetical protein